MSRIAPFMLGFALCACAEAPESKAPEPKSTAKVADGDDGANDDEEPQDGICNAVIKPAETLD